LDPEEVRRQAESGVRVLEPSLGGDARMPHNLNLQEVENLDDLAESTRSYERTFQNTIEYHRERGNIRPMVVIEQA